MRVELGGAAGNVQRTHARSFEVPQHDAYRLEIHLLGAGRAGVDVAMHAALIAFVAKIDLERLEGFPADCRKLADLEERKR
jgi:hypothetical protein